MFKKILMRGIIPALVVSAALLILTGEPKHGKSIPTGAPTLATAMETLPPTPALSASATEQPSRPAATPARATRSAANLSAAITSPPPSPTPAPTGTVAVIQPPRTAENWKDWPVMPVVSEQMRQVYQDGLARGTNPHAFSILGDCQSQPEAFLGAYDKDPEAYLTLPANLQETVRQFAGSFNRHSPTVKDASTAGALLWGEWNDNPEKKCTPGETPIDCELRTQRPSIVLVHIGTHWEARNKHYLELLIGKILDSGAVPVLATKADDRELDERVNREYAELSLQYDLPLWNFWGAVKNYPNHGLIQNSDMYLTPAALEMHRRTALEALDRVWRGLN